MNVTHGLRRVLQLNPAGLATVHGDRRRTWREVGNRVARLASGLHALGAAANERLAILALNSDRYLEAYLATAWAGAVIVPLNIRWNGKENEEALRDCRPKALLFDKTFAPVAVNRRKAGRVELQDASQPMRDVHRENLPGGRRPASPSLE